ncbi:MAG: hypothetical protein OXJ55_04140 [Caldilineaceae bacterium]|nr:hypothetical protein [Caldilineaceae bacterium]MDE0461896.1 hypothetical protein [Caldilineaceae bacterium]
MKAVLVLQTRQQPFKISLRSCDNMRCLQEHKPLFDIGHAVNPSSAFFYAEAGLFGTLKTSELV